MSETIGERHASACRYKNEVSESSRRSARQTHFWSREVNIHWAVNGDDQVVEFSKRIGYALWGGRIAFRHGPLSHDIHNTDHPINPHLRSLVLHRLPEDHCRN